MQPLKYLLSGGLSGGQVTQSCVPERLGCSLQPLGDPVQVAGHVTSDSFYTLPPLELRGLDYPWSHRTGCERAPDVSAPRTPLLGNNNRPRLLPVSV